MRAALLLAAASAAALLTFACRGGSTQAAPEKSMTEKPVPKLAVAPIAADRLCVTMGAAAIGAKVTEPTVRAVALGTSGDAASLSFVFRGNSATTRELASGESRRQLGLKLRAQDGCNLVYVMWRLDPKPAVTVQIKRNPGMRTHKECGANGYTRLKPSRIPAGTPGSLTAVPALSPGESHTLRAEISHDELLAWIDDLLVWRGPLPPAASELSGPAGLRSDNVSFDITSFSAPAPSASGGSGTGSSAAKPKCEATPGD
jgi:hypothetical protein